MRTFLAALVLAVLSIVSSAAAQAQTRIFGSAYTGGAGAATLYSINPSTGAATAIGPIGFNRVGALDFSPGGVLYGVGFNGADSVLITINTGTGAGTLVGALGIGTATQDIAFRSDGTLFAYAGGTIYTINTSTGVATTVGNTGNFPDGNAIAFRGGTLFLGNTTGGTNGSLQTVNQTTGAVTLVVDFAYGAGFNTAANPRPGGMKFDPATRTLFAAIIEGNGGAGPFLLGIIDPVTGAVTDVGTTVTGLDGLAILPAPGAVPLLSGATFAALIAMMLAIAFAMMGRKEALPRHSA